MAEPKVTFKVELDDSSLRGQLNSIVNQLTNLTKGQNVTVNVSANTSAARGQIDTINDDLNNLNGRTVEPSIDADNSAATTAIDETTDGLNTVDSTTATATVDANNNAAEQAISETQDGLDTLDSTTATPTINADNSAALEAIQQVEDTLNNLDGRSAEANINVNTTSGDGSDGGNGGSGNGGGIELSSFGDAAEHAWDLGKNYNYSRAKASTLMESGTDMNAWDATVLGLSSQYGQSAATYNEAAYNMLSAGQSQADLPALLGLASQLSIGGFTDVDTASGMLARVGNAYGSNDYQGIANATLLAQNYGITDVGKLAHALPQVASTAAGAGVGYQDLLASYAAITHGGVMTNVASTEIGGMINELNKTGSTGQKTLAAATKGTAYEGMSFSDIMAAGASMGDVARMIGAYGDAKGLSFADMFSNQTAAKAVQDILGSDNGSTFDAALQDMTQGVDAVTPAFEKMAETTSFTMDQIMAELDNSLISLFNSLAPSIQKIAELFASEKFQNALSGIIDKLVDFLGSDSFETFIDALASATETLVNLLSGDYDFTQFLTGIGESVISMIEGIMPDWLKKMLGVDDKGKKGDNEPAEQGTPEPAQGGGGTAGSGAGRGAQVDDSGLAESVGSLNSEVSAAGDEMGSVASSASSAASNATRASSNMSRVSSALSSLAGKISAVTVPSGATGGTDGQKSVGMSYVAKDGYRAVLHKGEAVLTAAQASVWRNGMNGSQSAAVGIDYNELAEAMSQLSINVNGKRFSRAIERDMSNAQGARYSSVTRRG